MGDAQRGDDAIYFYAANLGRTRSLAATAAPTQLSDVDGALTPGRYLLHLGIVSNSAVLWVATGKFKKGGVLVVAAAPPHFPMSSNRVVAIEINVRKGANDQIAAVAAGPGSPSGTLYITQISRGA